MLSGQAFKRGEESGSRQNSKMDCKMDEFTFDSAVRGYHVCQDVWKPTAGEKLHAEQGRFPFVWKNRLFRWEIKWNGPFHWKFFGKKGIPSEVFLFSRFSRNDRKISVPFATTSLFAHRARSTSDPKNAETYPLNRFKLIQNSCRV